MKKLSLFGSSLAAICTTAAVAPLAHAAEQPQFSATATGGIDSVYVEIHRPADFLTACHTYGVPSGADPLDVEPTFESNWTDGWNHTYPSRNDTWNWGMPALSIQNGDYDVYWACYDPNEDPAPIWGSDPEYKEAIDELAAPIQITIQPESDRETIGDEPSTGGPFGSLASLGFGS